MAAVAAGLQVRSRRRQQQQQHRRFVAAAAQHASSSSSCGDQQQQPALFTPTAATEVNVSTVDDDDAPQISPDELRGAVAGAQLLERSIGESSVDYLSVS